MGCSQSKIDQEEAVVRCRDRKRHMAEAVAERNALAAAHSAYTVALKSTGGALSDYARGETPDHNNLLINRNSASSSYAAAGVASSSGAAPVLRPPVDNLPPPPPPLPNFTNLVRSASMPVQINSKTSKTPTGAPILEEDGNDGYDDDDEDDDDDDDDDDHHIHDDIHDDLSDIDVEQHKSRSIATPPQLKPMPAPVMAPTTATPPPPMSEHKSIGTWEDYFFADTMQLPTLAPPDEEPWQEMREPEEPPPKVKKPQPKLVRNDPIDVRSEELPPMVIPEKAKVVAESLQPAKPIRKPAKPPVVVHHQHAASVGSMDSRKGKIVVAVAGASLLHVISELDDHFLKASESAHDVSKMLEATRMHYHSNFADSRGHIDHSARIMRVITWNRSFKGLPQQDDTNDNVDNEECETHATILDKMLAWEKKLYDEVKAGELMKIDYQRKVALLNKQKKGGVKPEVLEKTKAAVSHLHTRYIVDMQSMDSTVSEINRLRDKQLYPKLVQLVGGMAKMWEAMHDHHRSQFKIVISIRSFEMSPVPRETSDLHHKQTGELLDTVKEWHLQFEKLMYHQKEYIKALNCWLKQNLIPIESSLKEKVSSPPRPLETPIKDLLHAWQEQLERLPIELAKTAIKSFEGVIGNIKVLQEEEVKMRRSCEEDSRELERSRRQFEDWHRKYLERRASLGEQDGNENANPDPVTERKVVLQEKENKLKEKMGNLQKLCKQVREKSLGSLRSHLPELFRNMAEFAFASSAMYKDLLSITSVEQ